MKRKNIWLLLTIIPLLVSCGGGENSGDSSMSNSDQSSTTIEPIPGPVFDPAIKSVEIQGWLTGPEAATNTQSQFGLGSTDLGIPIYDDSSNRMYFAFGDSYSGSYTQGAVRSGNWASNVFGYTSDLNAGDGVTFDGFLNNKGKNAQIIPSYAKADKYSEWTIIPTGGIVINKTIYVYCMSVRVWGESGIWTINYNTCYKSSDDGATWSRIKDLTWARSSNEDQVIKTSGFTKEELANRVTKNFLQIFPIFSSEDNYVYIYGVGEGRTEGMKLARVRPENIESFSEYEYFEKVNDDNTPSFIKGVNGLKEVSESDECYIIDPQCAEPSVMYNKYLNKWVVMTMRGNRQLYMHLADKPWGNFDKAILLCNQVNYPSHYGGYVHEKFTEQDGKVMYVFLSLWDKYNVRILKVEMADK